MTTQSATTWSRLANPDTPSITPTLTGINRENYIVVCRNSIQKYDFLTDTWLKLVDRPVGFRNTISLCQSTLDTDNGELWIFNAGKLAHIYLNENKESEIYHDVSGHVIYLPSKSVLIDNKFTIIGGSTNNSILQWNESNKQFTKITTIYGQANLCFFGLIHVKSTNCLLLFGGWDYFRAQNMDSILQYNITQNKWTKLAVSLPKNLLQCECTMAIREQYVLIFSGFDDGIYIYSIKHKTLRTSKVKCPSKRSFSVITVNNEMKDEKIVFGFVRNEWKISEIDDHYFPPYYLLKTMQEYYLNEFVYLLEKHDGAHWGMSTLDIL